MSGILALGAHPDDIEFGCAGLLQQYDRRVMLVATHGERGGHAQARRHEAEAAAVVLGADLKVMSMPDTRLVVADLIPVIERFIDDVRPDMIVTLSGADEHQDHRAMHEATRAASRSAMGTVLAYATPTAVSRWQPTWFVKLSVEQFETKRRALACHESQAERYYLGERYVVGMANYWASVKRYDCEYVEAFELICHKG